MPSKISLRGWDELYRRALRIESVDAEVKAALGVHAPRIAGQIWTDRTILTYATGPQDRMALGGSRVRSSARSTTFSGATRSGIGDDWYAVEFGDAKDDAVTYGSTSRRGRPYRMTRHTQRMLPARNRRGRVLYRYGKEAMRRMIAAYTQTIARTIHDAIEGK
jgi:hypothetical protein